MNTTISVTGNVREKLKEFGKKGETYSEIWFAESVSWIKLSSYFCVDVCVPESLAVLDDFS